MYLQLLPLLPRRSAVVGVPRPSPLLICSMVDLRDLVIWNTLKKSISQKSFLSKLNFLADEAEEECNSVLKKGRYFF